MLPTTLDAVRALLKADPSLTPADRAEIVAAIRSHGRDSAKQGNRAPAETRILRRDEVARRFGRSLRFVDLLARNGILRKVLLPGRKRACGFRSEDVDRLMRSEGTESAAVKSKEHLSGRRTTL